MALCKLTRTWNDGQSVYVNPLHVVSVDLATSGTYITTNANSDGKPHQIFVKEDMETVVRLLDAHMPNMA